MRGEPTIGKQLTKSRYLLSAFRNGINLSGTVVYASSLVFPESIIEKYACTDRDSLVHDVWKWIYLSGVLLYPIMRPLFLRMASRLVSLISRAQDNHGEVTKYRLARIFERVIIDSLETGVLTIYAGKGFGLSRSNLIYLLPLLPISLWPLFVFVKKCRDLDFKTGNPYDYAKKNGAKIAAVYTASEISYTIFNIVTAGLTFIPFNFDLWWAYNHNEKNPAEFPIKITTIILLSALCTISELSPVINRGMRYLMAPKKRCSLQAPDTNATSTPTWGKMLGQGLRMVEEGMNMLFFMAAYVFSVLYCLFLSDADDSTFLNVAFAVYGFFAFVAILISYGNRNDPINKEFSITGLPTYGSINTDFEEGGERKNIVLRTMSNAWEALQGVGRRAQTHHAASTRSPAVTNQRPLRPKLKYDFRGSIYGDRDATSENEQTKIPISTPRARSHSV